MAILILGANSDIAKACARRWAARGETLHLALRNPDDLGTHKEALESAGATVHTYTFDATDAVSRKALLNDLKELPETTLCAFGYQGDEALAATNAEERHKMFDVNLIAAVDVLAEIAERYKAAGKGTIAGIASVAGDRGKGRTLIYGAAKAGFTSYLDGLRNALNGTGVHVVTIKPGFVRTQMTAGMDTPGPLTATADKAAKDILRAIDKKKNTLYTKAIWRPVMKVIRSIPEPIFKKKEW